MIIKLKNEINDMEQQLKQKDTHIQFKDEIIKELRQQRRSFLRVWHWFTHVINDVSHNFLEILILCHIFVRAAFFSFRFILFSVRIISERQNWIHSTKLSIWFERCHVISALIHQKSVIATLICIKKRKIKPMNRHATRWPMNMFGNLNLSERKSSYWMRKSIKMWVKFIQCKTTGNIWILVSKWLILHSFF